MKKFFISNVFRQKRSLSQYGKAQHMVHQDRSVSFGVCLVIGQLISCSKQVTFLGNCGCVGVSSFPGVGLPEKSP
jgi:hypothetical protein